MINGQILLIIHKGGLMLKNKSIDYIFGMITGASLMVTFWACTSDVTASGSTIQDVRIVNESWDAVNVTVIE